MEKIIGSFIEKISINGEYQEKEFFVLAIENPVPAKMPLYPYDEQPWEVRFQTTFFLKNVKYFRTEADAIVWIQKVKAA